MNKYKIIKLKLEDSSVLLWVLLVLLDILVSKEPQQDDTLPNDIDETVAKNKAPQFPTEILGEDIVANR